MARVTGLGGAFLRADDPQALHAWYEKHLGLKSEDGAGILLPASGQKAYLVVSFFTRGTEYFPLEQAAMLNFQVDDLDGVLDGLEAAGVKVDPTRQSHEYGRFGWFTDPEGNRVELWQPPAEGF
jgi:predicted enzyme related to lactoylglutathione lyase